MMKDALDMVKYCVVGCSSHFDFFYSPVSDNGDPEVIISVSFAGLALGCPITGTGIHAQCIHINYNGIEVLNVKVGIKKAVVLLL
jgi:hypothetical protein